MHHRPKKKRKKKPRQSLPAISSLGAPAMSLTTRKWPYDDLASGTASARTSATAAARAGGGAWRAAAWRTRDAVCDMAKRATAPVPPYLLASAPSGMRT